MKYILLSFVLSISNAVAGYGDIEPGKCYDAKVFLYRVTKKLNNTMYEIHGLQVTDKYELAIYETKRPVSGTGLIGGRIKITGKRDVPLENGFAATLFVFGDCK